MSELTENYLNAILIHTAPSEAPEVFSASNIDIRRALLSWSPPRQEDRNGIITSYHIDCSDENGTSVLNTTTEHTSISLDGLAVGSLYKCYLSALTSVGGGPAATLNFTTLPDGITFTLQSCIVLLLHTVCISFLSKT